MPTFEFKGLDEFMQLCNLTVSQTDKILGRSIYPGGGIMYREALAATQSLPVDEQWHKGMRRGPTAIQKEGLEESLGIAPIRKERWGMNVKIGYDGYNKVKTGQWAGKGQPNMMIARVYESGTSFAYPHHFMDRAVNMARPLVETAIEQQFSEEIVNIWGTK